MPIIFKPRYYQATVTEILSQKRLILTLSENSHVLLADRIISRPRSKEIIPFASGEGLYYHTPLPLSGLLYINKKYNSDPIHRLEVIVGKNLNEINLGDEIMLDYSYYEDYQEPRETNQDVLIEKFIKKLYKNRKKIMKLLKKDK